MNDWKTQVYTWFLCWKHNPDINSRINRDLAVVIARKIVEITKQEKVELLRQLSEYEFSGYQLQRHYSIKSNIREMRYELLRLKVLKDEQKTQKLEKELLMLLQFGFIKIMDLINKKTELH